MLTATQNTDTFETLQELCRRGETGRLDVRKGPYGGSVHLQSGHIIDVDLQGRKGQAALLELLGLTNAIFYWFQGTTPYQHTCYIPLLELEALWFGAGLSEKPSTDALAPTSVTTRTRELGVALPKLTNYEIVLQAQDPAHRPSQHTLTQPLKPAYLIGAAPDCDIHVDHYSVCQIHGALIIEDNMIRLWDLGSNSATHINGDLADEGLLQNGDVIQIGDIAFKVILRTHKAAANGRPAPSEPSALHKPGKSPMPSGPLRFETIRAERRKAEMAHNPLFKLFDTLRPTGSHKR